MKGEVMALPQNCPVPEHLPKSLTMKAHAEEGGAMVINAGYNLVL